MTDYLDLADFLRLMERTIGAGDGNVRDFGLLKFALVGPQSAAFRAFCALNGIDLRAHEDEAHEVDMTVAGGEVNDVGPIAA